MPVVVDTNKIIAALLRDGTVKRTLFCLHIMDVELLSPGELVEELLEHIDEIASRMGMNKGRVFSIPKKNILSKVRLCDYSILDIYYEGDPIEYSY